ncbi:LamG-like jellyroll fold domain-containing protein, partial [Eudoraea sp.]|uniref:LamG-like jellyroll fold domain-containing protein n=1 Tax=Eudoraea sp. TaxID=1979955 RepID=UPI003C73A9D8
MKRKVLTLSFLVLLMLLSVNAFAQMQTSVSQYGITWTFDQAYETGQFVTGDWWVVGPVTITSVSPGQIPGKNGSVLNPEAGPYHGYDASSAATYYRENLRVSYPLTVSGVNSLVSTISVTRPPDCTTGAGLEGWISRLGSCDNRSQIQTMAVLTIVNSAVPAGTFRPPYVGSNYKEMNSVADACYDILPRLPKPGIAPVAANITKYMERPMLDHFNGWTTQLCFAFDNAPGYGAAITNEMTEVAVSLMFDYAENELQLLANLMIQRGIDSYGALRNGVYWPADGGHASGRKLPILIAGKLLDHAGMLNIGFDYNDSKFGEDCQTYFDASGFPRWGIRHCQDPNNASFNDESNAYRTCCTSSFWGGQSVVAQILGLRNEWNHEAFFAYTDRWINEGGGINTPTPGYASSLWNSYRWNLPAEIPYTCGGPAIEPTSVNVSPTTLNLYVGATSGLTETVLPSNATNKSVTWLSNNTSVATVNSSGLVTAVSAGSATITVTTVVGNKTATCAVSVTESPFNPDIIAKWDMNETSGTVANDCLGTNDGNVSGAIWNTGGKIDGALSFDGNDDLVSLGNMDITSSEFTIALWAKFDDFDISDARLISKATGVQEADHYWMISTNGGDQIRFRLKTGGTTGTYFGTDGSLTTNTWTHIAVTYDGSNVKIYKDYTLQTTNPKTGAVNANTSVPAAIGNQPQNGKSVDGLIDDVYILSKALTQTEIQNLALNGESCSNDDGSLSVNDAAANDVFVKIYPNPVSLSNFT